MVGKRITQSAQFDVTGAAQIIVSHKDHPDLG